MTFLHQRPVAAFVAVRRQSAALTLPRKFTTAIGSNNERYLRDRERLKITTLTEDQKTAITSSGEVIDLEDHQRYTPWSTSTVKDDDDEDHDEEIPYHRNNKRNHSNKTRFRQHVNPLSAKYQIPTILKPNWPANVFSNLQRPLFLDIGSAKGGFLLDIAEQRPNDYNYLGLEIRPSVALFAKERIEKRGVRGWVDFLGCNANVDLDRILQRYAQAGGGAVQVAAIQYPDPHFKARTAKRRVVTTELVQTLATHMPEGAVVFLQSDIQPVLDDMRERFRDVPQYFQDEMGDDLTAYLPENYVGIPTEREVSVLKRGLPVFRSLFRRTAEKVVTKEPP